MKIAITGAHSTGKSTLVEALKKLPELDTKFAFNGNITRNIKKAGNDINENGNDTTQLLVIAKHIENYVPTNVILDRCALDGLVYTTYLYNKKQVSKETLQLAEAVFENLKYDIIFYIKPEFDIVKDNVRSIDLDFRNQIVDLFDEYITSYKIPVIPVSGTVKERVQIVQYALEMYDSYLKNLDKEETETFKVLNKKLEGVIKSLKKELEVNDEGK